MTNTSLPPALKSALKHAQTGAQALDQFAKDSEKALKSGEEINVFQKAMAGLKFFGKASAVLQCINVGMTIIGEFAGQRTTEQVILQKVNELLGRVKALGQDAHQVFGMIEQDLKIQTGKLELNTQIIKLETCTTYLENINARRLKGQPTGTLEDDFLNINPTDFVQAVDQIRDCTVGTGSKLSPNILEHLYDRHCGDIRKVLPMAEYLIHQTSLAIMLHIVTEQIQYERGTPTQRKNKPDPAQIASLYKSQTAAISKAVSAMSNKCFSLAEQKKNVIKLIGRDRMSPMMILANAPQASAERIAYCLQEHYPYLNFSVITYEYLVGWKKHATSGGNCVLMKGFSDMVSEKMNIFVYWAKRTKTNRQPLITYDYAVDSYAPVRKDRTFDTQYRNAPLGSRYVYIFDLAKKVNFAHNHSIFYGTWGHINKDLKPFVQQFNAETDRSKVEANSVLWIGFSADYDDNPRSDFGLASYNSMYGNLDGYTPVCFFADTGP